MSVEGVWKVEMLGPYGWEQIATAFLLNGRYLAASADHHSIGSYRESGGTLRVKARITQYGKTRALFGGKKKHLDLAMEGRVEDTDKIVGTVKHWGGGDFDLSLCLTRLGELDRPVLAAYSWALGSEQRVCSNVTLGHVVP